MKLNQHCPFLSKTTSQDNRSSRMYVMGWLFMLYSYELLLNSIPYNYTFFTIYSDFQLLLPSFYLRASTSTLFLVNRIEFPIIDDIYWNRTFGEPKNRYIHNVRRRTGTKRAVIGHTTTLDLAQSFYTFLLSWKRFSTLYSNEYWSCVKANITCSCRRYSLIFPLRYLSTVGMYNSNSNLLHLYSVVKCNSHFIL